MSQTEEGDTRVKPPKTPSSVKRTTDPKPSLCCTCSRMGTCEKFSCDCRKAGKECTGCVPGRRASAVTAGPRAATLTSEATNRHHQTPCRERRRRQGGRTGRKGGAPHRHQGAHPPPPHQHGNTSHTHHIHQPVAHRHQHPNRRTLTHRTSASKEGRARRRGGGRRVAQRVRLTGSCGRRSATRWSTALGRRAVGHGVKGGSA